MQVGPTLRLHTSPAAHAQPVQYRGPASASAVESTDESAVGLTALPQPATSNVTSQAECEIFMVD